MEFSLTCIHIQIYEERKHQYTVVAFGLIVTPYSTACTCISHLIFNWVNWSEPEIVWGRWLGKVKALPCLFFVPQSMSWPGWQLVNLSDRRDKIWRWQLFLLLPVFDTSHSLCLCVIPSLVRNHRLTFHRHHASPVCQAQNRREEGKGGENKIPLQLTFHPSSMRWFQVTVITVY